MNVLALLRCLKYPRGGNTILKAQSGRSYTRAHSTQRFTSSLASQTLSTSLLYENDPIPDGRGNADLVDLVEQGRYGEAYRLRLQLLDSGVEISHHPIFEKAAVSALQWHDHEKCLKEFSTWFSLVPNINEAYSPGLLNPFQNIRHSLLHSGAPAQKLPVIFQFGMICASKGYTEPIFREVFQFVVRYARAMQGGKFMLDIEKAATQYQLDHHPENATLTAQKYRALAVEICVQVGWIATASKIIQLQRDFPLPDRTYRFLLERLKARNRPSDRPLIKKLRQDLATQSANSFSSKSANFEGSYAADPTPIYTPSSATRQNNEGIPGLLMDHSLRRNYERILHIFSANFTRFDLDGVFDHTLSRILVTRPRVSPQATTLLPLPDDCRWIVLKSIVNLSTSLPWALATLESLYDSFLSRPYGPNMGKVFESFISAFGKCGSLDLAQLVVSDIRQLQYVPYPSHLARLAGAYARWGKVDQAMNILDELERTGLFNGQAGVRYHPQVTTYGRIIAGFVDAGLLEPALTVEARLMQTLPYTMGKNSALDRVLDTLRALQTKKIPAGTILPLC